MNCKPGDLAVVVSAGVTKQHCIGRIVLIVEPYRGKDIGDWIIEYRGEHFRSLDRNLRPIRDPGDDAQDETLDWLPSPTKETA